jgi:tetratricopeptide (TPR) repeat protein
LRRRLVDSREEAEVGLRLTLHPLTRTFAQARVSDVGNQIDLVFVLARTLTAYFNDRRLLQLGRDEYLSLDFDVGSVLKVAHRLVPALDATVPNLAACRQFRDLFAAVSVPLWSFGYWSERVELGRRTIQACELAGDTDGAARAAATVAIVKYWQSDIDAAEAFGRRALEFTRTAQDRLDVAIGERVLALTDARRGDVDGAVAALSGILTELDAQREISHEKVRFFADWPCLGPRGHESGRVALNQEIGIMLTNAGRFSDALPWLETSRRLAEEIDDAEGLSISLSHLGRCHLGLSDLDSAQRCLEEGFDLAESVGRMSTLGRCLLGLAQVAGARKRRGESEDLAREAGAVFERLGMAEELRASEGMLATRGGRR